MANPILTKLLNNRKLLISLILGLGILYFFSTALPLEPAGKLWNYCPADENVTFELHTESRPLNEEGVLLKRDFEGKIVWRENFSGYPLNGISENPKSMISDGENIFFLTKTNSYSNISANKNDNSRAQFRVVSHQTQNGKQNWASSPISWTREPNFGLALSQIDHLFLHKNLLIVYLSYFDQGERVYDQESLFRHQIIAFDKNSGEIVWENITDLNPPEGSANDAVFSSDPKPGVLEPFRFYENDLMAFYGGNEHLYGLDCKTGKLKFDIYASYNTVSLLPEGVFYSIPDSSQALPYPKLAFSINREGKVDSLNWIGNAQEKFSFFQPTHLKNLGFYEGKAIYHYSYVQENSPLASLSPETWHQLVAVDLEADTACWRIALSSRNGWLVPQSSSFHRTVEHWFSDQYTGVRQPSICTVYDSKGNYSFTQSKQTTLIVDPKNRNIQNLNGTIGFGGHQKRFGDYVLLSDGTERLLTFHPASQKVMGTIQLYSPRIENGDYAVEGDKIWISLENGYCVLSFPELKWVYGDEAYINKDYTEMGVVTKFGLGVYL